MNQVKYYFRPECGMEDRMGQVYGPYPDYLQLTYTDLRIGPDGETVAVFCANGFWRIIGESQEIYWTDIVIWAQVD